MDKDQIKHYFMPRFLHETLQVTKKHNNFAVSNY